MATLDAAALGAEEVFADWLTRFAGALESAKVEDCFNADGYWKDILTLDWSYRTLAGPQEIRAALAAALPRVRPRAVRVNPERLGPRALRRAGRDVVEAFFDFDTEAGRTSAFVRLHEGRAWLLVTALQELHGFEERSGDRRPSGIRYAQSFAGDNWADERAKASRYVDHEPQVLIVGGGQSGLALAARCGQMGVDALIVERNERVGDNWRRRYHSLTLHNEIYANALPYVPYPPTWPSFLPKDKLAGWLEAYAEFMELNVWTATTLLSAEYDEGAGRWAAHARRADGSERTLRPSHLVVATGSHSGIPHVPALPGLDAFAGEVMHSTAFSGAAPYAGRRAIVVGTGNSGHDIAQELFQNDAARVTLVQRGPTAVVSLVPSGVMIYALYAEGPVQDMDLIYASIPYPVLVDTYKWMTARTCDLDRELLDRLHAAGFETDFEPDGTGFHMKYLRYGGGYYINVGCSELIADGDVGLVNMREIETFTAGGLRLTDGREVGADLVVLATGFEPQEVGIRRLLGDAVADRVGPVWGFDEQGFARAMWTRTGQPGLWIMGGGLNECRLYSRFLAVQLKAQLEGLMPA
ncbi:MAG TPA: NAD(P)/FAD-dependent oxidoreductase [Solirubrobacteraceae bacterium]|jgi:cation diffusion facilitator CzcD-associated flavoprotein CzcO|nr:NAD(P)/FAD-dependent oxidoreductase [Solirubrobacteraceae bacterium]